MKRKQSFWRIAPLSLSVFVGLMAWGLSLPAWGQERLQSRYAVVSAQSASDLVAMERRLRFATPMPASQPQATESGAFDPVLWRLGAKIDAMLLRASRILNLWPAQPPRLNIILLANGKEVRQRHLLLVPGQRPGLFGYGSIEAFYEARSHTIYLSLRDLDEGILAHEMAHFLLCSALALPPPPHVQEAWARYVESQL